MDFEEVWAMFLREKKNMEFMNQNKVTDVEGYKQAKEKAKKSWRDRKK